MLCPSVLFYWRNFFILIEFYLEKAPAQKQQEVIENFMYEEVYKRYLNTSVYTDTGIYKEFILSLSDDIRSIGMLVRGRLWMGKLFECKR